MLKGKKKTIFQVKYFKHFCNSTLKGKQNRLLVYTLQHKEASRMLLAKPSKIEPSSCRKFDSVSNNKSFSFKILKIRLKLQFFFEKLQLTCIHVSIFLNSMHLAHFNVAIGSYTISLTLSTSVDTRPSIFYNGGTIILQNLLQSYFK